MKGFLKWLLIIFGGLVSLVLIIGLVLYGKGQARLNKTYTITPRMIKLPTDDESLHEGKRIFQYRGCEACHGEELQGVVYMENPAIGQVITPNLTRGEDGIGDERTDLDLIRAVKYGVSSDGTASLFMPSTEYYYLSDLDLGRVLAYIRSKPAVDNQPEPSELSTTGFIVMNLTQEITFLPAELIPFGEEPPTAPDPGLTPEYGEYLALSCPVCHGLELSGGEISGFPPEWPAAGNLTSGPGSRLLTWGEEGFIEIIQYGKKHGRAIHPDYMPWNSYRHMNDLELQAVYQYLMSLEPAKFGNR